MCDHKIIPIIELDDNGQKVVFSTVCINCLKEFVISPMLYSNYVELNN